MAMPSELVVVVTAAMEVFSVVGVELALFACAAIAYLAFSGGLPRFKTKPSKQQPLSFGIGATANPRRISSSVKVPPSGKGGCSRPPTNSRMPQHRLAPIAGETKTSVGGNRLTSGDAAHHENDYTDCASDICACGRSGDLLAAVKLFEQAVPSFATVSGGARRSVNLLLNSMIDACTECRDLDRASSYLTRAHESGLADVVSFNTLMKGYLTAGDEVAAERLLTTMGVRATQASFHGLMNARVSAGDRRGAWILVGQMQTSGATPNAVTCAILLKAATARSHAPDIQRVLGLLESSGQSLDEVLLSSLADACLRVGQLDLLTDTLTKARDQNVALSAPTYGSLIKSHGQSRDVGRCWTLWRDMLARKVKPTQITVGCMVEALVANGRAEEAWQLVQELWEDEAQRLLVNTVSFSTLLKGFAKQSEKVVSIYEEMRSRSIQCNTITYNTILNAFAESGDMARAPKLLDDMKGANSPVEPDMITYSTLIKGFCSSGHLDKALQILREMRDGGRHAPDEVLYNSLLDGCAREQRVTEALELVDDMKATNVKPSNYTLSMLVKLMGRCSMLAKAFSILEDFTKAYSIRPNIQVYTCLIQACFQNRQVGRAVSLLDRILEDGITPDEKLYTALVRGCLQAKKLDQAVQLVRRAYEGNRVVGVDPRTLSEVLAKLGASSEAAEALRAEVKRMDVHGAGACVKTIVRSPPSVGGRNGDVVSSRGFVGRAETGSVEKKPVPPWRCSKTRGEGRAIESDSTCMGRSSGSGSDTSFATINVR